MTDQITTLTSMMDSTVRLMRRIGADDLAAPTPCDDFTVAGLLEHLAVWVQVFDGAVNDRTLSFDPATERIETGWAEVFERSTASIIIGLRERGFDRPMTMTSNPIPGVFVMSMLLMEYVGHGWDLAQAIGVDHLSSDEEASVALDAARSIIQPEYRGTGMFDREVVVTEDADQMTRFVAFTGRDPNWAQPAG